MKPDQAEEQHETDNLPALIGDVIGDTAYSERFVLKTIIKLANLDSLKEEINDKSFEDDLCTLWDMTAERDVVLFIHNHDVLQLFNFALPMIESPRVTEIIIGIIGNMCCQKEIVIALLKMETFMNMLMDSMKTDDSLIIIQLLRLVSSCLFVAEDEDITYWMNLFESIEYSTTIYFILKNSSNKDLLVTSLENLNTVFSYCNIEKNRTSFFTNFVTVEALESLSAAFTEITVNHRDSCNRDELERMLEVVLQILLTLVGFDKSPEMYNTNTDEITNILSSMLSYYENKFVEQKEVDSDLVDIIDSTNTIVSALNTSEHCGPDKYFIISYNIWKSANSIELVDTLDFEGDNNEELYKLSEQMRAPLCLLLCSYMQKCSDENLCKVLDVLGSDFDIIVKTIEDNEVLYSTVMQRTDNYRTRLKDTLNS